MRKENEQRGSTAHVTRRSLTGEQGNCSLCRSAHLYSLSRTRELVDEASGWCSSIPTSSSTTRGGAGGSVSELLPKEVRMDFRYLGEKGGGRFVRDRVKEIYPKNQGVTLLLAAATPAVAARCSEGSGR